MAPSLWNVVPRRALGAAAGSLLAAGLVAGLSAPGVAADTVTHLAQSGAGDDPALRQSIDANEEVAPLGTEAVLDAGHVDMGPFVVDGEFDLLARDDSDHPPVWRHLDDLVYELGPSAQQDVPADDPAYEFIGAEPGKPVYVVPQTQLPDVPWLGWNTQAPSIVDQVARGVNFEFVGHQGPGRFSLFLQAGGFAEPDVIWNDAEETPQRMFVELNTHTHANWVFTEPGVHLVGVRITAQTLDGEELEAFRTLRFAVDAPVQEARDAQWEGDVPEAPAEGEASGEQGEKSDEGSSEQPADEAAEASESGLGAGTIAVIVAAVVVIGAVVAAAVVLSRQAKKTREQARALVDEESGEQ